MDGRPARTTSQVHMTAHVEADPTTVGSNGSDMENKMAEFTVTPKAKKTEDDGTPVSGTYIKITDAGPGPKAFRTRYKKAAASLGLKTTELSEQIIPQVVAMVESAAKVALEKAAKGS
jgi:hypothetical protein